MSDSTNRRTQFTFRRGLTLVELMVSITVIGILVSLLMTGVFGAIESSRRLTCQNNIRQVGLALGNYAATFSHFPSSLTSGTHFSTRQGMYHFGPHVHLLPYFDLGWGSIDLHAEASMSIQLFRERDVSVYRCPSDFFDRKLSINYFTNQGAVAHLVYQDEEGWGPFVRGKALPTAMVTDGLTHTVSFSERLQGSDAENGQPWPSRNGKRNRDPYYLASELAPEMHQINAWTRACSQNYSSESVFYRVDSGVYYWDQFHNFYNHILAPNSTVFDCIDRNSGPDYGLKSARSLHLGGVQALYCDGHVSFISDSINFMTWRAVGTASDAEIIRVDE